MRSAIKTLAVALICCAGGSLVSAQTAVAPNAPAAPRPAAPRPAAAKNGAQIEAGEPRAKTSGPATTSADPAVSAAHPPGSARKAGAVGQKPGGADRLTLGTATVTGSQEQPKVMYIVPWKRSDIGDLTAKPMNSLVDEILAPVDRDVFKREVVYYQAVQADASQKR